MKAAIISLEGHSSNLIAERCRKYFDEVSSIPIKDVDVKMGKGGFEVSHNSEPLEDFDCVYVRGSHRYEMVQIAISSALEGKSYVPLHYSSFPTCHNKLLTLLALRRANVPVPKSYVAAKTPIAKKILEKVEYPIIIKIPKGTQGKGVMFADSLKSARTVLDALEVFKQPYIIQEYIETGSTDIRAIVVGGKVAAAMKRRAKKDEARANLHMGGSGEAYELDYDTGQIALRAAKAVNADICGIDILKSKTKAVVIEANTSPGLKGISEATGKDVADNIAKFLFGKAESFRTKKKETDYSQLVSGLGKKDKAEVLINLNVKAGVIKLPTLATSMSSFKDKEEVALTAEKGRIEIKKSNGGED